PISTDGGTEPRWSRSGREIVYRSGDKVMAAEVESGPAFRVGKSATVFEGRYEPSYDVSSDGQRFLMIKPSAQANPAGPVRVALGWLEELKRRVPTGR